MYSYGPPHIAKQKQDDQLELTYSSYVKTGCNPEDLPEAMNDREKWRERVRDIRAGGMTWWWWFIGTYWWNNMFDIFIGSCRFLIPIYIWIIKRQFSKKKMHTVAQQNEKISKCLWTQRDISAGSNKFSEHHLLTDNFSNSRNFIYLNSRYR